MKFIKKHKKGLIILAVIVLAIGGLVLWLKSVGAKAMDSIMAATNETVVSERRDLVKVVSATGKVTSVREKDITSTATGAKVKEVYVEAGDEVKEGDVLMVLDSSDIEENLESANKTLSNTQKSNSISVSAAKRGYDDAVLNSTVTAQRYADKVAEAEKDQKDSKDLRDQAKSMYENAVDARKKAEENLKNAKKAVENGDVSGSDATASISAAELSLETAKSAESAALSNYNSYSAKYDQSESSMKLLLQQRDDAALQIQNSLATTKDQLSSAKISTSSNTDTVEKQIATLNEQLEDCTVKAPFDGIVTYLDVEEGSVNAGTRLAAVEDISSFEVTTEIDEYDIGKIKKGQAVTIKTNGTGDEILEGYVKSVAPRATASPLSAGAASAAGGVTYKVVIAVESKNDLLRLDMTAKLSIILEKSINTLTVPYDAVQEDEDGNKYVEVVDEKLPNGMLNTHKVYITPGIETDYYVEILNGDINEGDEIKISRPLSDVMDFNIMFENNATGGM